MGYSALFKKQPVALVSPVSSGRHWGDEMPSVRKTDSQLRTYFRSDRFTEESGKWFFYTREKTLEGPCESLMQAKIRLDRYIKVMSSGMMSENTELCLAGSHRTLEVQSTEL